MSRTQMLCSAVTALLLTLAGVGTAQAVDSQDSLVEQARALAAEADPAPPRGVQAPGVPEGAAGPLFVGVDDVTVAAERVDVTTNAFSMAFVGAEVWGSAYDQTGDRVLFNDGSTLMEWPVGGAVATVGTITDAAGAPQSMTGLAFNNDTLFGCRNIANEAIYEIDTTTLIATVSIDYADTDFDCGGLAIDPATGSAYMTNDDATPFGSGLFLMDPGGTGTQVTAYPAGETDIDGLAIGGGRAYLVIDQPGSIYVWDFALGAYQAPLTNPWASSEIFSAGAWIEVGVPEITLVKTVGLDPGVCGTETAIMVPAGTTVQYCFTVTNIGNVALGLHDLVDSHLGPLLTGFVFNLMPGESTDLIVPSVADQTVTNVATWTASIVGGPSAQAQSTATVTVLVPPVVEIPTLSALGLAALALVLTGLGLMLLRRRRTA